MTKRTNTFTFFRDDKAPIRFIFRDTDDAQNFELARIDESTGDPITLAVLPLSELDEFKRWVDEEDATSTLELQTMTPHISIIISPSKKPEYDLKIVRHNRQKDKKTVLFLLTPLQVGRMMNWVANV